MIQSSVYIAPAAARPNPRWHQIASFFREELKPKPDRLRTALVRVAGTVFAMWVGFALNVPEMGAVLAFAFFGSEVDKAAGKKVSFGVPLAIFAILVIVTVVENVFGVSPLVRVITMFAIIYACLFLMQASANGGLFLLAGVFGKLFITFWDNGYPAEAIGELQLWIVADLALAGLCAFLVSTMFGDPEKNPTEVFREKLAGEFDTVAKILNIPMGVASKERADLYAQTLSAPETLQPLLDAAAKKDPSIKEQSDRFAHLIRLAVLLQNQCLVLTEQAAASRVPAPHAFQWIADRCAAMARSLRSSTPLSPSEGALDDTGDPLTQSTFATVALTEDTLNGRAALPELQTRKIKKGFFREDAFTNPVYKRNAYRVLLASLACYCLMTGADWSGIGTSISTCLITALTTVPQARQKQTLRILGASIGAILALIALVFVLPHGGGITALSIVTAVITFIGAWVFAGSPRLNYAGVQIVLCFFLGTFGEGKEPTSLNTVRDRVMGIFIGNLAMWLFYDRIRPAWTVNETRCDLEKELTAVGILADARLMRGDERWTVDMLDYERKSFQVSSTQLRAMADPNNYEFKLQNQIQRENAPQLAALQSSLEGLFSYEFAAVDADLLGLPPFREETASKKLSMSLAVLAKDVEQSKPIAVPREDQGVQDSSREQTLLMQITTECALLFS